MDVIEKEQRLKQYLLKLSEQEKLFISTGKRVVDSYKYYYQFDAYCIALLNRSVNIVNGFTALAELNNYISAFTLVRVHLDSLLRLYAFQLIDDNIDNIALQIENGKQMNDFKCRISNRKLTDGYLVQKLSEVESFEWVANVYDTGNGFIHLSDKHMMTSMRKDFDKGVFSSVIGVGNNFIEIEDKIGACIYMTKISSGIYTFIESWIAQKSTYNEVN